MNNRGLSPNNTTVTGKNYTQQFGMTLASHKPVEIESSQSKNLLAATGEVLTETLDGPDLTAAQEVQLWAQAEPLFDKLKQSPEEKSVMWIPDIWPNASLLVGAAVAVAALPVQAADKYILGVCRVSQPDSGAEIRPTYNGDSYLVNYHGDDPRYEGFSFDSGNAKVTLVKAPAHGVVRHVDSRLSDYFYHYAPKESYFGQDRFVMQVEKNGVKVRIHYVMEVVRKDEPTTYIGDDGERHGHYCNPDIWKISSTTPALKDARLQALLDASRVASGSVATFADLTGGAIGQTVGTTITLDTNAAGHGWYIDYTPYLNEEYLPTSNPNLWVAKEGSEAAGKMDLLSVLLHEYGHALGIEHSADSGDYMAATLQPGVRRLPSSEELALMARLVAEAKASYDVAAVDEVPQPGVPLNPDQPGAPLPSRNGNGGGNVRTTRARISRFGTTILNADGSEAPQYSIVANPTLTDAKLQTGSGWETHGNVAIGNGAAVLSESTTRQTRLNQVFTIGPNDRYLSFTLADIALDDITNGPDDAFEVSLLDANSGASLLAGTGLTKTDAFLNLQANGLERAGQGVTSTRNADGSRTYRIDLSGIPAGTAVNLSFDLVGFAAATSHVTVRDIRLGVPETRDDAVTTAEDTPFDIAALANDVGVDMSASLPGFAPVVVAAPTHGQVSLNADGSFRYVPVADWSGEDSFTYKLSDGAVDSNVATVRVTVTPVNDAPVVEDRGASTNEDTPLTLDLLAGANDIDSVALTAAIVTGPRHGVLAQNTDGGQLRIVADDAASLLGPLQGQVRRCINTDAPKH